MTDSLKMLSSNLSRPTGLGGEQTSGANTLPSLFQLQKAPAGFGRQASLDQTTNTTTSSPSLLTPHSGTPSHSSSPTTTSPATYHRKPSDAGLHLQTHAPTPAKPTPSLANDDIPTIVNPIDIRKSRPALLHSRRSYDSFSGSPSSSVSSPALATLGDITALPSPLNFNNSPDLWRKVIGRPHSSSNASTGSLAREEIAGFLAAPVVQTSPSRKKKTYPTLANSIGTAPRGDQDRNRAVSEYVPDPLMNFRQRNVTLPNFVESKAKSGDEFGPPLEQHFHREEYQAKQRGLVNVTEADNKHLPTPPPSDRSTSGQEEEQAEGGQEEHVDLLPIRNTATGKIEVWRPLKMLGQGAFSQVMLAKRDKAPSSSELVAIKIVAHATGGDDEERMETAIQREIEILQSISHPCLPLLTAFDDDDKRALLVLNYCPGGDLFELASEKRELLTPELVQRIFAELVAAVGYLHSNLIVHRDIKLENVLFNIPTTRLRTLPQDLSIHPNPLITLTDLGLSKRIPAPPASALLTHPCGSADYAAPELLLGQSYDGRSTDAWALGVVLYALMEGRLPFDPLPVSGNLSPAERRRRTRGQGSTVKHRIARCDWLWCEFGDEEGEWLEDAGHGLDGAREIVEGLLKKVGRGRWSVDRVKEAGWVIDGIMVPGGLRVAEQ